MDSTSGWFTSEVAEIYPIHFITHLHGISYYIRPGAIAEHVYQTCQDIVQHYGSVTFSAFNNVLADEPVYALAMAILNLFPTERDPSYYCFVPFTTKLSTNYYCRSVRYENPKDGKVDACAVVHWGNVNTKKCQYRADAHAVDYLHEHNRPRGIHAWLLYRLRVLYLWYFIEDTAKSAKEFTCWFFERVYAKLKS